MTVRSAGSENRVRLNLFGRWLAVKRAEEGLTQKELADRLDVSSVTLGGWERGNLPPGLEVAAIAKGLRVSPLDAVSRHWSTTLMNGPFREDIFRKNFQDIFVRSLEGLGHGWKSVVFGVRAKAWRGDRTQEEAARSLGVTGHSLSHVETGRNLPGTELLSKWSDVTGIPLSELMALWTVDTLVKAQSTSALNFTNVLKEAAKKSEAGIVRVQCSNLLGMRIKIWRGDRTQEQAATLLGVYRGFLSRVEIGQSLPGTEAFSKWSDVTGIPLSELAALWTVDMLVKAQSTSALNFTNVLKEAARISETGITRLHHSNLLGTRVKVWRGDRTQKETASVLGVSRIFLSHVEAGRHLPGAEALSKWSDASGIQLSELASLWTVDTLVKAQTQSNLNFTNVLKEAAKRSETGISRVQCSNLLGMRIKIWRGDRTQEQAATLLGVYRGFLPYVEIGQYLPGAEALSKWSDVTGIPLSELMALWTVDMLVKAQSESDLNFTDVLQEAAKQGQAGIVKAQRSNLLGTRVKAWRGDRTQEEAARPLGVTQDFLSHVETGRNLPGTELLSKWSDVTGIPLPELAAFWIIDHAVQEYGILNLDLKIAFKTTLSTLPPDISNGHRLNPMLLNPSASLFLRKIRELLREQGISVEDQRRLKNLATAAAIAPKAFQNFLTGKLSVRDFLWACQDEDVLVNLARQLGYSAATLIGYLGIDLAFAYEVSQGRKPRYVAQTFDNGKLPGYDLDSFDPVIGGKRQIEVKASSMILPYYAWTPLEWETARAKGKEAFLLLVLNASLPDPTFVEVQNPAARLESRPFAQGWLVSFKTIRKLVESRGHSLDPLLPGVIKIPYEEVSR